MFFIAFIVIIYLFFKSKVTFRKKIRNIIRNQPNTIRYLKNGTFKRHELFKSLRDKVYDELSGKKTPVNRRDLDKIIDQEILKVLKGWKRRLGVYLGWSAIVFCIFFIAVSASSETQKNSTSTANGVVTNKSKDLNRVNALITSAQTHIGKSEFTLAKQDLDNVLKIDSSSRDAIKLLALVQKKMKDGNKSKNEEENNKKQQTVATEKTKEVTQSQQPSFTENDLKGAWYDESDDLYIILRDDFSYTYIERGVKFISEGTYSIDSYDNHFKVHVIYSAGQRDSNMTINLINKNHIHVYEDTNVNFTAERIRLSEAEGIRYELVTGYGL